MSRPKGSKNRVKVRRKADAYRPLLLKIFPRETVGKIEQLSLDSGISVRKIADDGMVEGLTCLREDAYSSLIKFNLRRGKIVHERDVNGTGGPSQEPALDQTGDTPAETLERVPIQTSPGTDPVGHSDAIEQPGHGAPHIADTGLAIGEVGKRLVDQITAELEAPGVPAISDDLPL
jgi:hypothetical protein